MAKRNKMTEEQIDGLRDGLERPASLPPIAMTGGVGGGAGMLRLMPDLSNFKETLETAAGLFMDKREICILMQMTPKQLDKKVYEEYNGVINADAIIELCQMRGNLYLRSVLRNWTEAGNSTATNIYSRCVAKLKESEDVGQSGGVNVVIDVPSEDKEDE